MTAQLSPTGGRDVHTVRFPVATPPSEIEVLVVGAGPSGLGAAVELTSHGVQVAVVDRAREATLVRAGAMGHSARTVEHFRRWGLLQAIRDEWTFPPEWNQGTRFVTSLVGHDLAPGGAGAKRPPTSSSTPRLTGCSPRCPTGSGASTAALTHWTTSPARDSYDAERRRHNWRIADNALESWRRGQAGLAEIRRGGIPDDADLSPEAEARRAEIAARLGGGFAGRGGLTFDERYDASRVVWYEPGQLADEPAWEPGRYEDDPRPGHRAPNGEIDPYGSTLYDRIGNALALLVIGDATGIDRNGEHALAAEAASRGLPFTVVHLSEPSLRAVYGDGTVLVRPDQHIAWRGTSLPGGGAVAVLDHVLGIRQAAEAEVPPAGSMLAGTAAA